MTRQSDSVAVLGWVGSEMMGISTAWEFTGFTVCISALDGATSFTQLVGPISSSPDARI